MIRQKEVERREENSDVLGRLKEPGCTLPVGQCGNGPEELPCEQSGWSAGTWQEEQNPIRFT